MPKTLQHKCEHCGKFLIPLKHESDIEQNCRLLHNKCAKILKQQNPIRLETLKLEMTQEINYIHDSLQDWEDENIERERLENERYDNTFNDENCTFINFA